MATKTHLLHVVLTTIERVMALAASQVTAGAVDMARIL